MSRASLETPKNPHVICHMMSSLDGRVVVERYSNSPDASREDYVELYYAIERDFAGDAYIVGRITMEPFAQGLPRDPRPGAHAARPVHRARTDVSRMAVVLDPSGRLHWTTGDLDGDHLVIVVGPTVSDDYLCELAERGLSYIVSDTGEIDPARLVETLHTAFGAQRLLVEVGGIVNGGFLAAGIVDEISMVLVPAIDGASGTRSIFDGGQAGLGDKLSLSLRSVERLEGGALHLLYRVGGPIPSIGPAAAVPA